MTIRPLEDIYKSRDRFLSFIEIPEPFNPDTHWMFTGEAIDKGGYGRFYVSPRWNSAPVHRVAYFLFKGYLPDDMEPDHTCKVKLCIAPEHLEAVTPYENNGRAHRRLTPEKVLEIDRYLREGRITKAELARMYEVTFMSITHIERGRCWRELTGRKKTM